MHAAEARRTRRERAARHRFARLLADRQALDVTVALTDEVMRFASTRNAVDALRRSARNASVAGFGLLNALGLRLSAALTRLAPLTVLRVVHARVRSLSADMILDAAPAPLARHVAQRLAVGLESNVNVLGEAVLGEGEARRRLDRVVEMMGRTDVNYVSVKLSSVTSQLITVDVEGSSERVADRLRALYRAAMGNGVFVNLDMEEYRDLRMTVTAFTEVLAEPEFEALSAGIVLQAYLPDSHAALDELLGWASRRHAHGGGQLKVRLVKGANLAMECAEAELHGWVPAPYATKADVDASYARMLDVCLRRQWAPSVRVGVASHNLFHLAWALDVARARGVNHQLDVEMLEGMANAEALALVGEGHPVLLYTPVTRRDDFASAVAYLVRRLDENTSPENYLSAAFTIAHDPAVLAEQRRRFLASVEARHNVTTVSRRHEPPAQSFSSFENVRDGDPTDPAYVNRVVDALAAVRRRDVELIGSVARRRDDSSVELGRDPSSNGAVWYHYVAASRADVDAALATATHAAGPWASRSGAERAEVLRHVAEGMLERRAETIAVMARDAGKTVAEADPEVSEAVDFVRYYAEYGLSLADSTALGVVVVVPPWNFPYAIAAGGVAAALAAGNVVVLKPAPEAVATAWELANQFWAGGVGRDVLQFVATRDDEVGRHLVTHRDVGAVILTGAFDTARLFTSWRADLRLLAETSGKNAMVVTACADIDLAVKDLVQSAFGHAGQKCSAASLAIVDRSVYEHTGFLRQLRDAVESLSVGAAYELATTVGPLIAPPEGALRRALTQLDEGESWLVSPVPLDEAGYLWRPGVRVGVRAGSWSHHHEWFGPVLAVMPVDDLEAAIAAQNAIEFGLTAGLHSLDQTECETWIDRVEAGNLYVNRGVTGAVVARQPFGGWKRSSVGPTAKAGGPHYVACLRDWPRVQRVVEAVEELRTWWRDVATSAPDEAGLRVERNVRRFRRPPAPVAVRVDSALSTGEADYLAAIRSVTGVATRVSAPSSVAGVANLVVETIDEFVAQCRGASRVRWLSGEDPPVVALLDLGLTTDRRPLAQRGDVEGPRWLLEQSVSVTGHRYGNVNAGPRPDVVGLNTGTSARPHPR